MSDRLTLYNARLLCAATGRDEIGGIVIEAGASSIWVATLSPTKRLLIASGRRLSGPNRQPGAAL